MRKKQSAKQRILNTLTKRPGTSLTTEQARTRFGIKNVAARIYDLREDGYDIDTNVKVLSNGRRIAVYQLGN